MNASEIPKQSGYQSPFLKVALLEPDYVGPTLKVIFEQTFKNGRVMLFEEPSQVMRALELEEVNALLIDIFSLGVSKGIWSEPQE